MGFPLGSPICSQLQKYAGKYIAYAKLPLGANSVRVCEHIMLCDGLVFVDTENEWMKP